MKPVAVLGAPRDPLAPDAVFGECRDCHREIMWREGCPDLPKLCVECVAKVALASLPDDPVVILPSGQAAVRCSRVITVH